jgi:hypothetical protein
MRPDTTPLPHRLPLFTVQVLPTRSLKPEWQWTSALRNYTECLAQQIAHEYFNRSRESGQSGAEPE